MGGIVAEPIHAILKRGANGMLQTMRFDIHLVPGKFHHFHQKNF
jgi:hypothetical protein